MMALPSPIVITGSSGMLGSELLEHFSSLPNLEVFPLKRPEFDLTSPESVRQTLEKLKPKIVLHTAAYTNVDGAESERELAYQTNAMGTEILSRACRQIGARIVYYSTDQVFDGTIPRPRVEEEDTRPANYYAYTKWLGERAALECPNTLILRVQWLYGKTKDRFTPLKKMEKFSPFSDQFGAPTWTKDIAKFTENLLLKEARGIFHFSYDDFASWADVFQFVKDTWDLKLELVPTPTAERNLPAARPRFSVMSNEKILRTLKIPGIGSWKDSLQEFLQSTNGR